MLFFLFSLALSRSYSATVALDLRLIRELTFQVEAIDQRLYLRGGCNLEDLNEVLL